MFIYQDMCVVQEYSILYMPVDIWDFFMLFEMQFKWINSIWMCISNCRFCPWSDKTHTPYFEDKIKQYDLIVSV